MHASLGGLLAAIAVAAVLVFPLAKTLKRHPSVFYLSALVVTALYLWAIWTGWDLSSIRWLSTAMQKGYVATILLAVVMFTGCFDEGTPARRRLQPVRGELSILSAIFILGHLGMYLPSYLPRFTQLFGYRAGVAVSLMAAAALTVVFALLAVTSFRVVRKSMSPVAWKSAQRLSYLMVALLAAHICLVLGSSALSGRLSPATVSLCVYMLVIAAYAGLRIRKWRRDIARRPTARASALAMTVSKA